MFRVVPDQLRISDGWVRCGQCGEVFDASQRMVEQQPEAPPEPTVDSQAATSDPLPTERAGVAVAPNDAARSEPTWSEVEAVPAAIAADTSTPPKSTQWPSTLPATEPQDEDEPTPSFMRQSPSQSGWHRPMVRGLLLLLAILLLSTLAVQLLIQNRDRIASMEPSTRPALLALCGLLRCQLSAPRQIESIVIESSSFSRIRGDSYRLGVSLRNNSALDLAMPSIELSLTDTQDQALIRRVLGPAELGAGTRLLAAGSDWNTSLALSINANPGSERISGYRVLAFYP
jgi:predicted Zn finger-like uncharacterized protein